MPYMPPPQGYDPPPSELSPPPSQQKGTGRDSNSAPVPSGNSRVEQRRNPDGSMSIQIGAQRSRNNMEYEDDNDENSVGEDEGGVDGENGYEEDEGVDVKGEPEETVADL